MVLAAYARLTRLLAIYAQSTLAVAVVVPAGALHSAARAESSVHCPGSPGVETPDLVLTGLVPVHLRIKRDTILGWVGGCRNSRLKKLNRATETDMISVIRGVSQ